jgi:hypothetical protein
VIKGQGLDKEVNRKVFERILDNFSLYESIKGDRFHCDSLKNNILELKKEIYWNVTLFEDEV